MIPILASHDPVDHVLPHRFFELLPFNFNPFGWKQIPVLGIDFGPPKFYFTNHLLMTLVSAGLCILIFLTVSRSYKSGGELKAPRGLANLFEMIMQFIRQDVVRPVLQHRTDEFMPFLWTLFFFILFCNLLGMIPLDSIIYLASGRSIQHVGGTATGNLAITGALGILAFFTIHVSGVRAVYRGLVDGTYGHHDHGHGNHDDHGHGHGHHHHGMAAGQAAVMALPMYLWNFAPHVFKADPNAGAITKLLLSIADAGMWVILLLLEFLGAVIKPFALMIRLFANMVAGHIVLGSIMALTFVMGSYWVGVATTLGCVALSFLELFVAFLQAYIFTFLTTLFIGASVAPEH